MEAAGYRVPDDMAVTGFDGFRLWSSGHRLQTTVDAHWTEVGSAAVDELSQRR
jgi:DNA-binding LacI/PurR family transcriptional regulator